MQSRDRSVRPAVEALEDRCVPAGVQAVYAVTQDWGSGFQAQIRLTNDTASAVPFTKFEFALPAHITSIWDANLTAQAGDHYTVTNAGWNATLAAGGSVTFGFVAGPPSALAHDFALNGVPLDGSTPTPPQPPQPPTPTPGAITFRSVSDWGFGMTGEITIRNTGTAPVSNWQLSFDLPARLTSIWSAEVVSQAGDRYTVKAADWNKAIPAGGSVTFGFSVAAGGVAAANFALIANGNPPPVPPPANRAPVATDDAVWAEVGKPAVVAVLANDTDADNDRLTVRTVGQPDHGTVTMNDDGTVTYTPAAGFSGTDAFAYTVADGRDGTDEGLVRVTVTAPTPSVPSAWPAEVFAPYVDATLWPTFDFVATARQTGLRYFTLAFITADPANRPAWGGYESYGLGSEFATAMRDNISALRALGGDVAVSFGGASGRELAEVITDVNQLTAAYRSVIEAYGLTHLDFDIEGAASAHRESVDRRSQAIAILQREAAAEGRELHVRFTLPVLPTGLTNDGLYVVRSAKDAGVRVDMVNIMAMDYGDGAAPNPGGRMGDYAIQAATSLFAQLTTLYGNSLSEAQRWAMIGVTPMIGLNDVTTEVFDQQEARELLAWAEQRGIGLLAMWSLNRDRQHPSGAIGYVDLHSSSLVQQPLEFSLLFDRFTG